MEYSPRKASFSKVEKKYLQRLLHDIMYMIYMIPLTVLGPKLSYHAAACNAPVHT